MFIIVLFDEVFKERYYIYWVCVVDKVFKEWYDIGL